MSQDPQTPVPAGPPGNEKLEKMRAALRAQNLNPAPPSPAVVRPAQSGPAIRESRDPRAASPSTAAAMKMAKKSGGDEPTGPFAFFEGLGRRFLPEGWPDIVYIAAPLVTIFLISALVVGISLVIFGGKPMGGSDTAQGVIPPQATQVAPPPDGGGVFGFDVGGPPAINVKMKVTLASVWMILIIIFGFAETVSRRERFALDFWAPILFVGVAVFRKQLSHDLWLILQTASATAVVAAIALNENRPAGGGGKSIWAQIFNLIIGAIDMTPLYQVGALLLALGYAKWAVLPYPTWIDPKIAWAVLIVGALFEISRAPVPTLIAVVLGGVAGFLFDPWLTMVAALIVIVMGAIFHSVGWLPATSHHGEGTVGAMGRNLTVALRWDLILLATITYFLVAITAHGNVVIYTLTRLAGG